MSKLFLIFLWLVLIAILLFAIFTFTIFRIRQMLKKPPPPKKIVIPDMPIDQMEKIAQNKDSPIDELIRVIKALATHHKIPPKEDGKPSKDAKRYLDMIFTMASHKHMTDQLLNEMYNVLGEKNPEYLREFNRARKG